MFIRDDEIIRKLAKSIKWQNLFSVSKEINSVKLFHNETELSGLQETFLNYLYFYHDIYTDLALKKITELVLKDDIYSEAYLYWKKNHTEKKEQPKGKDFKLEFRHPKKKVN